MNYKVAKGFTDTVKEKALGQNVLTVKQLQLEIEEKDLSIRKQIELKRLTDNHVTNLEVMIGNLRQDNENMAQTIAVLNRHAFGNVKEVKIKVAISSVSCDNAAMNLQAELSHWNSLAGTFSGSI